MRRGSLRDVTQLQIFMIDYKRTYSLNNPQAVYPFNSHYGGLSYRVHVISPTSIEHYSNFLANLVDKWFGVSYSNNLQSHFCKPFTRLWVQLMKILDCPTCLQQKRVLKTQSSERHGKSEILWSRQNINKATMEMSSGVKLKTLHTECVIDMDESTAVDSSELIPTLIKATPSMYTCKSLLKNFHNTSIHHMAL